MSAPAIGVRPGWLPSPTARVDSSHPLASGLSAFVTPGTQTDLVTGNRLSVGGTGVLATPQGGGSTSWSASAYQKLGDGSRLGALAQFSVVAYVRTAATTYGLGRTIYSERATSGNDICKMAWSKSGNTFSITYRDNLPSGLINNDGVTSVAPLTFATVGMVRTSATAFQLWVNGRLDSTFTAGAMTTNFSDAGLQQTVGIDVADSPSHWGSDGGIAWVGCWTRALSANDMASLNADPFQMIRQ